MMSKAKQIEEMACDMCKACDGLFTTECEEKPCWDVRTHAKLLYNAGYRKQSENTVEVVRCKDCQRFLEMETSPSYDGKCLGYGYLVEARHYCSYGEPKMEGGAE